MQNPVLFLMPQLLLCVDVSMCKQEVAFYFLFVILIALLIPVFNIWWPNDNIFVYYYCILIIICYLCCHI